MLIELPGLLTGLGLCKLQHLIYAWLLLGFVMLIFFTNLSHTEFQVRYLSLFLFSVIVLDRMSSQEYPVHVGSPQVSILGPTIFLLYINNHPDDVVCDSTIYADDTTLYSNCDRHLICGVSFNWPLNLNL